MRALVVEDEPAIARILVRKLQKKGFDCSSTNSIAESKKLIGATDFDLLFLDYVLVDGRSKELAVEGYLADIPNIFLMSAFMDDLDKEDFAPFNVIFLKKPFKDLESVLSELGSA